jgi:DNA mismatch repair protein MutS2
MLDLERQNQHLLQQIQENENRTQHLEGLILEYTELKEKINSKRQAILEQTRVEAKQLLSSANQQIEQTIRIIRENSADKAKTNKAREKLDGFKAGIEKRVGQKLQASTASPEKENQEKPKLLDPKSVMPGAKVKNRVNGQSGEVLEVKKDKVLVVFGLIKMWVPFSELQPSVEKQGGSKQRTNSGFNWVERQSVFSDILDLHGVQPDESLEVIAKWLGEGYALGRRQLKIVHGKGTGVLRRTVRNHLKSLNFVKSYHSEDKFNGGDGCTIVVLN